MFVDKAGALHIIPISELTEREQLSIILMIQFLMCTINIKTMSLRMEDGKDNPSG